MSVITPVATTMRRITEQDNPAIAAVIRTVSAEYGLTADKGYTVSDPNLDELFQLYSQPGHAYWVIEQDGQVVGGGGIAPLLCSEPVPFSMSACSSLTIGIRRFTSGSTTNLPIRSL
jgi:putative acetyltransferase